MNHEQAIFFAIAKAVRKEMDLRKELKQLGGETETIGNVNPFIHVNVWTVNNYFRNDWKTRTGEQLGAEWSDSFIIDGNRFWAIVYKLQKMGLIKIIKGHHKKRTRFALDKKGVEYIKNLKKGAC